MTLPRRLRLALLAALGLTACSRERSAEGGGHDDAHGANASASAKPPPPPSEHPPPHAMPEPVKLQGPPAACRALRVQGGVSSSDGTPLRERDALPGKDWLTLAAGAEVVVRHGESGREWKLVGPGRVLPCRAGLEQVVMSRGALHVVRGTGVRPGGELWLFTPFGALHFGDATLDAKLGATSWSIDVKHGSVWTEPAVGARGLPAAGLSGPKGRATVTSRSTPASLVKACESAAEEAKTGAEQVLSGKTGENLGKQAAAQLLARRRARAACGVARAGLDRAPEAAERSRLEDQLSRAESLWQAVPGSTGTPKLR